jgi:hypothetical protein
LLIFDLGLLGVGMSGGADYQRFLVRGAQFRKRNRAAVKAEIDDDIAIGDHCAQVVALVNLADDLQVGDLRGAIQKHLAHAAFGTSNDNSRHNF